ncbi:unnamed protein product [Adineta steineri]|uniref:Protein-tyrosine-phosphatase n=1 Tax=Adineta steineri TaxID=433720 RepID=A0A814Q7X4_9BILA|nr:unnamed protein product [Adineta steineri]CAF3760816.1 unnamed protein product [Adineta steineri]
MSGITEVIDNLYISGLESPAAILSKGIRSIFNISSECPRQDLGPGVEYEKVHVQDIPSASIRIYFDRLTDRIEQNLQDGKKTLVHCYVGRSRSATIILAYLMKYQQMSLRDAFYYLRSRRPIVGPNFGFIRQLMAYEKSLFGSTSVSFIDSSYDSIPDIYLSPGRSSSRRQTPRAPIQITNKTFSTLPKPSSFIQRSPTYTLPTLGSRSYSSYTDLRPLSSNSYRNSSFLHDPPELTHYNSTYDSLREPFYTPRVNALRTGRYIAPFFNRFYLP